MIRMKIDGQRVSAYFDEQRDVYTDLGYVLVNGIENLPPVKIDARSTEYKSKLTFDNLIHSFGLTELIKAIKSGDAVAGWPTNVPDSVNVTY